MTGNIENAAATIASALVYLADTLAAAIRAGGFFSQKATFAPMPNANPGWTMPEPQPFNPYISPTTPSWPNTFPRITCGDPNVSVTSVCQADGQS